MTIKIVLSLQAFVLCSEVHELCVICTMIGSAWEDGVYAYFWESGIHEPWSELAHVPLDSSSAILGSIWAGLRAQGAIR